MKRKLKRIAGVAMAAAMVAAGSTAIFAKDMGWDISGEVDASSVTISAILPTGATLTIKPYGKTQISTGVGNYFTSGFDYADVGDAVSYKTSIAGYVATVKTKGENAPVYLKDTTWVGTTKQVNVKIQIGKPVYKDQAKATAGGATITTATEEVMLNGLTAALTTDKDKEDAWVSQFPDASVKSVVVERASDAAYDETNAPEEYTKVTTAAADVVQLQPGMALPVRITGSMNPDAAWEAGDGIGITPIFKLAPDAANTATTPSSNS